MWTRSELKQQAKAILRGSYWESVAAVLIVGAISSCAGLVGVIIPFWGSIAVTIFLSLPLTVGLNFYFMQSQLAPPRIQNVFFPYEGGRLMKIVGAMAWMYLFVFLWSLIACVGFIIVLTKWITTLLPFITTGMLSSSPDMFPFSQDMFPMVNFNFDSSWIPILIACGVIYLAGMILAYVKMLSYSMTPYILTDNPAIGYARALKLSIAMTNGHKWRIFVLWLSFIGWGLLALLTLGIGFLFLAPYVAATQAQLYVRLRDDAINGGLTTAQELNVCPK
jgi:uncharacterized membrane protein